MEFATGIFLQDPKATARSTNLSTFCSLSLPKNISFFLPFLLHLLSVPRHARFLFAHSTSLLGTSKLSSWHSLNLPAEIPAASLLCLFQLFVVCVCARAIADLLQRGTGAAAAEEVSNKAWIFPGRRASCRWQCTPAAAAEARRTWACTTGTTSIRSSSITMARTAGTCRRRTWWPRRPRTGSWRWCPWAAQEAESAGQG